ncbi:D-alanyl-D-alanine carboxypeptidase [Hoeflea marina]|uniref:D-alanyl-D-alanine carboxypeptidase n=1 Tax=Hoeflea marina TaxID=274592 RepID=A0A317PT20_9HYPH|nr:D-alanyl-D-alanine carboxypeptidase family protein [Hoeflea marina]PWW03915.1 D-alanyl-D-alanine carboxypeptidase [Hoeflea marina]
MQLKPFVTSRTVLGLVLASVLFAVSACSTTESLDLRANQVAPVPTKYAAIVVDVKTGEALYSSNANAPRYPASLTKMMTLFMLFEAMQQGRVNRDSLIPISANAARQPPSKIGLKPGQTIPVDTAIRALVVKSGNDVATAVGEYLAAGSEQRFAEMMTARARSLGMSSTTFRNASGLPDPGQVTTATDMARLAIALRRNFPQYYGYFSQREMSIAGRQIKGHNRAMDMIPGADGIKTGYTRASGFNLTTSVQRGGHSVVGVVMGEDTAKIRDARMAELIAAAIIRAK